MSSRRAEQKERNREKQARRELQQAEAAAREEARRALREPRSVRVARLRARGRAEDGLAPEAPLAAVPPKEE